ncbi:hypothetical protein ABZW30_42605 [Kitasatospora sp. NPDC004669]|uniref:hypothetical protein n=1 Tax=Kitasatospora sp. NPDC004669 TaxID=3154555 RepID=UPI0033B0D924
MVARRCSDGPLGPSGALVAPLEAARWAAGRVAGPGSGLVRRSAPCAGVRRWVAELLAGTTITFGGDELVYDTAANTVTGVRYYPIPGGTTLVRQGGKSTYQIADHHGTGTLAIDGTTLTETRRPSDPFGNPRGTQPTTWAGDHGFVGGTADDATGLTKPSEAFGFVLAAPVLADRVDQS